MGGIAWNGGKGDGGLEFKGLKTGEGVSEDLSNNFIIFFSGEGVGLRSIKGEENIHAPKRPPGAPLGLPAATEPETSAGIGLASMVESQQLRA